MKPVVLALAAALAAAPAAAADWYEGGTLHDKTIAEWNAAKARDRVATAADWTVTYMGAANLDRAGGLEGLHRIAVEVATCIDTATNSGDFDHRGAADVALICLTMLELPKAE